MQKIEAGEINLLLTTVLRIKRALKCPRVKLFGVEPSRGVAASALSVEETLYGFARIGAATPAIEQGLMEPTIA